MSDDILATHSEAESTLNCIHSHGVNPHTRDIYLMGTEDKGEDDLEPGVEFSMANKFIKNLTYLDSVNNNSIYVHMKTCGGIEMEGMAIYNAIKGSDSNITVINYNHARSMSSIILQAADCRIMYENSVFMFHEGTITMDGTVKQFTTEYEQVIKWRKWMLNMYATKMREKGLMEGKNLSYIKKWLRERMDTKEDVYLTAQETVDYGLADFIKRYV